MLPLLVGRPCCRLEAKVNRMRGPNERVIEYVRLPRAFISNRVRGVAAQHAAAAP